MQSFRTELENPIVEKDIIDLEKKIRAFREGKIHDEKFRSLRLARGIYGQRQPGVQMIRIKLPFGKVSFGQEKLFDNLAALVKSIQSSKPASSKGKFIRKIAVSSTMGVGITINPDEIA